MLKWNCFKCILVAVMMSDCSTMVGEEYFLPLTVWGILGFGIQPWGRIDKVLI